jgi:hypothetical protein
VGDPDERRRRRGDPPHAAPCVRLNRLTDARPTRDRSAPFACAQMSATDHGRRWPWPPDPPGDRGIAARGRPGTPRNRRRPAGIVQSARTGEGDASRHRSCSRPSIIRTGKRRGFVTPRARNCTEGQRSGVVWACRRGS